MDCNCQGCSYNNAALRGDQEYMDLIKRGKADLAASGRFKTDEMVPVTQETPLEKMYRTSFETANAENKRLSVKVAMLQKQVDEKDELAAKIQAALERELANAEFEIGRMANLPLMRFVRWAKGWQ